MTALDDGLNTSAPVWLPPNLTAVWDEAAPDPNRDVLDEQMTGEFTVGHSIDDGLPDPVTMTTSNDASGKLTVPLVGKAPTMVDARQYFSPFNSSSPVYGLDRDVAPVSFTQNTLTPTGPIGTNLFQGQMADVSLQSGVAQLDAVSKTRLALDTSLILPMIRANRESLTIDWVATWAMARGGQYAGPAPSRYTRYWAPFYGSAHAHFESIYCYSGAVFWDISNGITGLRSPKTVPGPFMTAMYGQQTSTRIEEVFCQLMRLDLNRDVGLPTPGDDDVAWPFNDQMSLANSAGRISFWMYGNDAFPAPSYTVGNNDLRSRYLFVTKDDAGTTVGYVHFQVNSGALGLPEVQMGSTLEGFRRITFSSAVAVPNDGQWHFVGAKWDFAAGVAEVNVDGVTESSNAWFLNGENNTIGLPATETDHIANGGLYDQSLRFHAPVSDLILEAGPEAWSDSWARNYPTPVGSNAIARPTGQPLQGLALAGPIQGWDLLTQLAQSALVSYRVNEADNFEWLPPSYFGEVAQQTPVTVQDTEVNAQELDVKVDPSKARNVVTVNFPDTMVDSTISPCLQMTSAFEIPRGTSFFTFTLDSPITEIHGALTPFDTLWVLTNLNSTQITNGTQPPGVHFITVNTKSDGTGTVVAGANVDAQIQSFTATTVTIRFRNILSTSGWLANNYQGDTPLPALRILGYGIRSSDGYTTERDPGSIGTRRERALDSQLGWVQDRVTAQEVASALITTVSHPRAEVDVVVMGDPRRKPGDLVTLADAQTTQAAGNWRVTSVTHDGAGAQYTQKLHLVSTLPAGIWDQSNWDESSWGV